MTEAKPGFNVSLWLISFGSFIEAFSERFPTVSCSWLLILAIVDLRWMWAWFDEVRVEVLSSLYFKLGLLNDLLKLLRLLFWILKREVFSGFSISFDSAVFRLWLELNWLKSLSAVSYWNLNDMLTSNY